MIEKSKVYPQFTYAPERYQIDHFHNPYLAKLSIKLTPRHNIQSYQLISPLSLQNNMHISQSIPIFRNQKFKLALIWKQYVTNRYAYAHFGTSLQYKLYESLRIKSRAMMGITSLFDIEVCQQISKSVQGFVGYAGLVQNNSLFNSFNIGLRKGPLYAYVTNKMSNTTTLTVGSTKQINNEIFLSSNFDANVEDIKKGEIKISMNQKIDSNSMASFGVTYSPYYQEGSLKMEYQRSLTKTQKVLFSTEYLQGKSIFYLGFKNLNFNFAFPFFAVDGPIPIIVGAIAFISTYIYKRTRRQEEKTNQIVIQEKTEEIRLQELKLISDKAADSYEREKNNRRGILIQEAFIGPEDQVEEFMNNPQRFQLLLRSEEHRQKFVDLTVTLRFYVIKGELKLRKGQKNSLLGFYRKRRSHNKIGIRYIKNNKTKTVFFDYMDPIVIQNQQQ